MTQHVILSTDSQIQPGKVRQLEKLLERLLQHIQRTEPGTLYYGWFIDEKLERCHVIQHYMDGDALLFHLHNYKPFAAELNSLRKVERVVCCGSIPEGLVDGFNTAGVDMFEMEVGSFVSDTLTQNTSMSLH